MAVVLMTVMPEQKFILLRPVGDDTKVTALCHT